MQHKGRLIKDYSEARSFLSSLDPAYPIAVDTETYKTRPAQPGALLLGISITGLNRAKEYISAYLVFHEYDKSERRFKNWITNFPLLCEILTSYWLVGWNVPFDKMWLDYTLGIKTAWHADGRIMWHLQNNDFTIRGFGLKLAQKKLLNWSESNDKPLEDNVILHGGRLKDGGHYLADTDILSHYACLDTYSTLMCYEQLRGFFIEHDYMWFHDEVLKYAIRLQEAGSGGLPVNITELLHAAALYKNKREQADREVREICKNEITALEDTWKTKRLAGYKTIRGRERFLASYDKWRRFNPSSSQQRATLLHTMLEFPVLERTPTGKPKTDRANLAAIPHNSAQTLVNYSEYKKTAEAAQTYLNHIENGMLYTNYDVCGTVSGRLSGFKPSVLNMPFSEAEVMHAFTCLPGFVGIHADLAAIEPCVLAHYTEDPGLLKVYKEGKGDIYLDLALDIFPDRTDLREAYDPQQPVRSDVKERFKDLRAVCKIIHLAVSYTGTHVTVAKNLSKAGYLTDKGKAMQLVGRYWDKFRRVKAFNHRLQRVYDNQSSIRNLVGRIIQVPEIYRKDLMNRLVQSSAHDILRIWVEEIINSFTYHKIEWRYWLPDLHDSTTFMVKEGQEDLARHAYLDALKIVEERLKMSVPLKCELKFCKTLAGLKGNE